MPRVLFAGPVDTEYYALVLDGLAEQTLQEYVLDGELELDAAELVDVAAQMMAALADVHRRGAAGCRRWWIVE